MADRLLVHPDIPPFVDDLGLEMIERGADRVIMALPDSPRFQNRKGDIHGGAAATLIDTTLGYAATEGDPPGTSGSTLTLNVSYLAAARGRLICTSSWQRRGKSIRFLEASVVDEAGTMVAKASATFKVFHPRSATN